MARLALIVLIALSSTALAQVNQDSNAYAMGRYVGYAFIAVLVYLIVRKIIKK